MMLSGKLLIIGAGGESCCGLQQVLLLVLCDSFADLRNEIVGNVLDGFGGGDASFVFGDGFLWRLVFIVFDHGADAVLIPAFGKVILAH